MRGGRKSWKILTMVVLAAAVLCLFSGITMALWNWLMPAIFGLRTLTFAQALGLLLLSKILFGGFRPRGGRRGWRRGADERWAQMTPEERERMRSGLRGRWACGAGRCDDPAPEQKTV